jgi:lipoprotein-anchoring transpeptidase ErfK/SrfK
MNKIRYEGRVTKDEGRAERINSCHASFLASFLYLSVSMAIFIVLAVAALSFPEWAEAAVSPTPIKVLRREVQALQEQVEQLNEENQGLRNMLRDTDDDELYLVVDTESNRLEMRQGSTVVLTAKAGTGSRQFLKEDRGRRWYFESPTGSLTVLGRERNPVWIRPDWSYVEENMPIPPANDPDRFVRDVLGKYAILLGNGYKIHGTKWKNLLGTHFTHGCVSLGDDDLEVVYKSVKTGTKVYIY